MTHGEPSFARIPPRVIILCVIEGIWRGKEDLKDNVVSKMIYELDNRGALGGFNNN